MPSRRRPDRVDRIRAEWQRERPDLDSAPQEIFGRLHRLANALTDRLVTVYAEFGLTEGEFDVLCALRRAGAPFARRPAEVARATMVTTGGLTKRLDRLEAAGLVRRVPDASDGRGKMVALTRPGVRLIDAAIAAHLDNEQRLLAPLSARDRAALERLLRTWLSEVEPPEAAT